MIPYALSATPTTVVTTAPPPVSSSGPDLPNPIDLAKYAGRWVSNASPKMKAIMIGSTLVGGVVAYRGYRSGKGKRGAIIGTSIAIGVPALVLGAVAIMFWGAFS